MKNSFLSCDWGTSSFRLRWVELNSGVILAELTKDCGVRSIHLSGWKSIGNDLADALGPFEACLSDHIFELFAKIPNGLEDVRCVVVSGMASSSIGWKELPYACLPFPCSGEKMTWERLTLKRPDLSALPVYLLSGMASDRDLIRGEETEIIGLVSESRELDLNEGDQLLILPGTHSKHVVLKNGIIIDFTTHMTGELFEMLVRHSILSNSADYPGIEWTNEASSRTVFQEGVLEGKRHGFSASLFQVRSRMILRQTSRRDNGLFLLGILVGAEMNAPTVSKASTLTLAGGDRFQTAYRIALKTIHPEIHLQIVPTATASIASTLGHRALLKAGVFNDSSD